MWSYVGYGAVSVPSLCLMILESNFGSDDDFWQYLCMSIIYFFDCFLYVEGLSLCLNGIALPFGCKGSPVGRKCVLYGVTVQFLCGGHPCAMVCSGTGVVL